MATNPQPTDAQLCFTVALFCALHNISKSFLYALWARGEGPERMCVGQKTLISREAAAAWRTARIETKHDRAIRVRIAEKQRIAKQVNKLKKSDARA